MTALEQDFADSEEEGYIEFRESDQGEFHLGCVHGQMDSRLTTREGTSAIEWTWDSNDEMDPVQGRGWAVIRGDELHGTIFFHLGDESDFVAKNQSRRRSKR